MDDDALRVPDLVDHCTVVPATLRFCASTTLIVSGSGSLVATVGVGCSSPETSITVAGSIDGPDESPHAVVSRTTAQ
jgi:hypothetical protein